MKKLFFILCTTIGLNAQLLLAQQGNQSTGNFTPDGNFDYVYDRFGSKYKLEDLLIHKPDRKPQSGNVLNENVVIPTYLLCSAGYFDLYFEEGSGFENSTPINIARRNVVCQVFTDISNFIVPADPSVKVNIWVRNIGNVVQYPINSGILGLATSFYVLPAVSTGVGGILDGQIWKTINSGKDGYTSVASPLITAGGPPGSGAFYHGMVAINFVDTPPVFWHTDLTTAPSSSEFDLYSTVLHEVTHSLGFASLINSFGGSNMGSGYPYYSRYDVNLQDFSSAPLIVTTSPCSLYDYQFNPSIFDPVNTVAPNPLMNSCVRDSTDCLLAVKYAGTVNQIVYTPNCFELGSSLSHLEDICYSPTPYPNNQYYTMANAGGMGSTYMMRYLKPEERNILCDIGYKVNTTYGNGFNPANFYNYGGTTCPGLDVAGVNDGILSGGAYAWFNYFPGTITISGNDLINNDYNADAFECLEVINGLGSVSVTSGTASTSIVYTPSTSGLALLRYIPVNTIAGTKGDITYVFMNIATGSCFPTACNMIMNEGFESGKRCGEVNAPDNAIIECWQPLIESPDYLKRGCKPKTIGGKTLNTGPTINDPSADTWNSSFAINDALLALGFYSGTTEEVEQTILTTPMMPNIPYTLSFWARSANSLSGGGNFSGPNKVMFRADAGLLAPLPAGSYVTTGTYLTEVTVPDDGEWHYYTVEFTQDAGMPLDNLLVGNLGDPLTVTDSYVFLDDFTLTPTTSTALFKAPRGLCNGLTTISDLSKFVFPAAKPGDIFSGPGVSVSGGTYSFTASGNGLYTIFYEYTNNIGCKQNIPAQIRVTPNTPPSVSLTYSPAMPPVYCAGTPIHLYAHGASTYAWYSHPDSLGATVPCNGPCDSIIVTPPAPGYKFLVIGTDSSGCADTTDIFIPSVNCLGPSSPKVRTFESPDDVKHYTTKIVPGTNNYSVMAGTIFHSSSGGSNTVHFLLLNNNGDVIISKEYPSNYTDERVVDIQGFTDQYFVTRWYIVCHANTGTQNIIKVLCVNNIGSLMDVREYADNQLGYNTYPMSAAIWDDGSGDRRLFICGYQTMGAGLDYSTPKQAFVSSININWGSSHMAAYPSYGYDWNPSWGSTMDYDIATRMAVLNGSNQIWVTGSTNGSAGVGGPLTPPDRSATMNLVIDPTTGAVVYDQGFIENDSYDDFGGPLEYGIDLVQVGNDNYILGNSTRFIVRSTTVSTWPLMEPRPEKIWWLQPLEPSFAPSPSRFQYNNQHGNWASQAIVSGGGVTIASLLEVTYPGCVPLPDTPTRSNIQVNMIPVNLSPSGASAGTSSIYMTSTGTGLVSSGTSYYNLGSQLSLIDYPPKFAALGNSFYAINAPKFINGFLNLKIMTPGPNLSLPCGEFNCGTNFIDKPVVPKTLGVSTPPSDIIELTAPIMSVEQPYVIISGTTCHDNAGNPSYRYGSATADAAHDGTTIYPNPATDMVTLQLGKDIPTDATIKVELQNILGQSIKLIYDGKANEKINMSLPSVAPGVYFVQVYANDANVLKEKLVIKK